MNTLIFAALISSTATTLALPAATSYATGYGYTYNPLASPDPSSQYHAQDEFGQYNYGYSGPTSSKQEFKTADGVVRGAYSYLDANGELQTVNYISDVLGFRAVGTNIPQAPAPVGYAQATLKAVPVKKVVQAAEPVAPQVLAPTVAYTYLPYANNYGYYFGANQAVPAVLPAVKTAAPAVAVQSVPVVPAEPAVLPAKQAPVVPASPAVQNQYHAQDEFGQYQFGYSDQNSARTETKTADGVVRGTYNYIDDQGHVQTVQYIADTQGFRAAGTNVPVAVHDLPVPTVDTPEVVAARAHHINLYNQIKAEHASKQGQVVQPVAPVEVPTAVVEETIVEVPALKRVPADIPIAPVEVAIAPEIPVPVARVAPTPPKVVRPIVVPATPVAVVADQPLEASQYHAQDELGQYNYGYSTPESSKTETKTADGVVRGSYSYIDQDGKLQTVKYISDALGFRVAATNIPIHQVPVAAVETAEPVLFKEGAAVAAAPEPVPVAAHPQAVAAQPLPVTNTIITPQVGYSYLPYATQYDYLLQPEPTQYHSQDDAGQYNYGYVNPSSSKQEVRTADGVVRGSYSYVDAYGLIQTVNYISDALGYRAEGTNIPKAGEAVLKPQVAYSYLPYAVNHPYKY